jgi:hypothetical protein
MTKFLMPWSLLKDSQEKLRVKTTTNPELHDSARTKVDRAEHKILAKKSLRTHPLEVAREAKMPK